MRWRGWHEFRNILYNSLTWKVARTHATYATSPSQSDLHATRVLRYTLVYMDLDPMEWLIVSIGISFIVLALVVLVQATGGL